jgi:hypothetical protein
MLTRKNAATKQEWGGLDQEREKAQLTLSHREGCRVVCPTSFGLFHVVLFWWRERERERDVYSIR